MRTSTNRSWDAAGAVKVALAILAAAWVLGLFGGGPLDGLVSSAGPSAGGRVPNGMTAEEYNRWKSFNGILDDLNDCPVAGGCSGSDLPEPVR